MKTKKHRENLIKMACIYYTRWAHLIKGGATNETN